ncbi:MAG: glycosyltransferase family 2 protein [Actinobacteria bacterium]|nr:glycosyltransferase family 2 protein [Actinomycetota bacterium]
MGTKSLIVIVTYNSQDFIENCLRSITGQNYKEWFLVVIDNGSSDNSAAKIREFRNMSSEITGGNFKLITLKKNIGFSRAVNYAVFNFISGKKKSLEEELGFLILLNPDIYLNRNALQKLISTFRIIEGQNLPPVRIGAAGGLILDYKKDAIQHLGGKIKDNFITSHIDFGKSYFDLKQEFRQEKDRGNELNSANDVKDVDYVTGAFFATEFKLFKSIGGFDSGYRPAYFEELDYCLKIRRSGWRVVVNPKSIARHFEGASVEKFSRNFYRYYHKNRVRCAIINLGFLNLLKKFFPSELNWLRNKVTSDQIFPIFYAYFINFVFLPYNLIIKLKNHLILNKLELK